MLKFKDGIKRRNLKKRLHKTPVEQVGTIEAPFELDQITSELDAESGSDFPMEIYDESEEETREVPKSVIRLFESGESWSNTVN